jgi:hypothetical protein
MPTERTKQIIKSSGTPTKLQAYGDVKDPNLPSILIFEGGGWSKGGEVASVGQLGDTVAPGCSQACVSDFDFSLRFENSTKQQHDLLTAIGTFPPSFFLPPFKQAESFQ